MLTLGVEGFTEDSLDNMAPSVNQERRHVTLTSPASEKWTGG